jgi:fatty-acid desaturase
MSFIDHILQPPSYRWQNEKGELVKPSPKQLLTELLHRINIFSSKKNWIALAGWFWVLCLIPFAVAFFTNYFNWGLFLLGTVYCFVVMSTHGTIWYHRYCTHRAYKFSHPFWRFITQNLVVKLIPEEIYVVSHHVHHSKSDMPGDPYNASAGFLYCFLADTNHQPIHKDMNEEDYNKVTLFLNHTGIKMNSYAQYRKWGSIGSIYYTALHWVLNWAFWYTAFYLVGGHALACALFTGAMSWVVGVRTFNYNGHGKGKDQRRDGLDYNWKDKSVNQYQPGLLSGEWHNNHHLFPNSARAGFLPSQIDTAWCYIYLLYKIGGVSSYNDAKSQFYKQYYIPYQNKKESAKKNNECLPQEKSNALTVEEKEG